MWPRWKRPRTWRKVDRGARDGGPTSCRRANAKSKTIFIFCLSPLVAREQFANAVGFHDDRARLGERAREVMCKERAAHECRCQGDKANCKARAPQALGHTAQPARRAPAGA